MNKLFTFLVALTCATTTWAQDSVAWDSIFVDKLRAWRDGDGTIENMNNTGDGITATFDGPAATIWEWELAALIPHADNLGKQRPAHY